MSKPVAERQPRLESAVEAPVKSRGLMAAAIALLALFTIADIGSRGVIVSILYAVPLVVLVRAGYANSLRWVTVALVVAVYAVYFLKWALYSAGSPAAQTPFDFHLVNRTFVVLTICMLEVLLKLRMSTASLSADVEIPESMRREEEETDETLAVLLGVAFAAGIALADFFSPANYYFAILYIVPLFFCAWTRSRRLLWGGWGLTMVLTVLGFVCGPPATAMHPHMAHLILNRMLAGLALTLLAVLLHFQIGHRLPPGDRPAMSRWSDSRRPSSTTA